MNPWLYILCLPGSMEHLYHPGCSLQITGTSWILIKVSQREAKAPCWTTGQVWVWPRWKSAHLKVSVMFYYYPSFTPSHLNDERIQSRKKKSIKQIKCQCGSADVHEDVLYLRLTYYSQQISSCTLSTWWTAQKSFDVEFTILAYFPSTCKRKREFFRRTCFSRLLMTSRSRFSSFPSSGVVKIMSTSWPNSFPLEMKTGLLPRRGSNDLLVRKIFSKSKFRILPELLFRLGFYTIVILTICVFW